MDILGGVNILSTTKAKKVSQLQIFFTLEEGGGRRSQGRRGHPGNTIERRGCHPDPSQTQREMSSLPNSRGLHGSHTRSTHRGSGLQPRIPCPMSMTRSLIGYPCHRSPARTSSHQPQPAWCPLTIQWG